MASDPFYVDTVNLRNDSNGNPYYEMSRTLGVSDEGIHGPFDMESDAAYDNERYRPITVTLKIPTWFFKPMELEVTIPDELIKPDEAIKGEVQEVAIPITVDDHEREVIVDVKQQKGEDHYYGEELVAWFRKFLGGKKKDFKGKK